MLESGTDAKDLKSYRALPRMFDRIFHPPSRLATSLRIGGASFDANPTLTLLQKMESEADRRPRSHSADANDPNTISSIEKIKESD